jgi:septal ring factor EnvC (AmiA/AmiB activator)
MPDENPVAPEGTTPPVAPTAPTAPDAGKAPTFTGEFDQARAERLVENLRSELADTKAKLKTREDAEKSDLQKLQERAEVAEKALAEATKKAAHATAKAAAAAAHKLPEDLHEFLTGETPEELTAQAKKLAERFGLSPATGETAPQAGRPQPRLVPGQGSAAAPDAFDPVAIAKAIRGRR